MSRTLLRLVRIPIRSVRPSFRTALPRSFVAARANSLQQRQFSITMIKSKGISPESENPQPKEPETSGRDLAPTELSIDQFHEVSDIYLERIVSKFEELQENREDVDVEYSVRLKLFLIQLLTGWSLGPTVYLSYRFELTSEIGRRFEPHLPSEWHICSYL
jgi:hypothetical protein